MFYKLISVLLVSMFFFSIAPQGTFGAEYDVIYEEEIELIAGDIKIIDVYYPERVSVRDPLVVDIKKAEGKEVIIVAKTEGTTTLTIWDRTGQTNYLIKVFSEDLTFLKERIEKMIHRNIGIPHVMVRENRATGKITLLGYVNEKEMQDINTVIIPFASKIENLLGTRYKEEMVEIDVRMLELNKSDLDKLGIKWQEFLQFREEPYNTSPSGTVLTTLTRGPGILTVSSLTRDALHAKINMLIQDNKGRELSRPKILCLSGEEAKLLVGGEVPYISGTTSGASGTTATIEYKEYGVKLVIRPVVVEDKVYASLTAEVTDLDPDNAIVVDGTTITAFTKRTASTVLNLHSGDTMFIGGLIKQVDSDIVERLPFLGNVPVLGALFRSKEFQNQETELVISLTPKIVRLKQTKNMIPLDQAKKVKSKKGIRQPYRSTLPQDVQVYAAGVQNKIAENIAYPREVINSGWSGTVVLNLNIDQYGELKSVKILRSSGYNSFDNEAIRLVNSLSFYPFPPEIEVEELNIEVPIVYKE